MNNKKALHQYNPESPEIREEIIAGDQARVLVIPGCSPDLVAYLAKSYSHRTLDGSPLVPVYLFLDDGQQGDTNVEEYEDAIFDIAFNARHEHDCNYMLPIA